MQPEVIQKVTHRAIQNISTVPETTHTQGYKQPSSSMHLMTWSCQTGQLDSLCARIKLTLQYNSVQGMCKYSPWFCSPWENLGKDHTLMKAPCIFSPSSFNSTSSHWDEGSELSIMYSICLLGCFLTEQTSTY